MGKYREHRKMSVRISKEDIDKLSREKRHVIEIYI